MIDVPYEDALKVAKDLKSEDGENIEYDRALLEYLWYAYGDDSIRNREDIAQDLGLDIVNIYQASRHRSDT